jgi:hypothetical protein
VNYIGLRRLDRTTEAKQEAWNVPTPTLAQRDDPDSGYKVKLTAQGAPIIKRTHGYHDAGSNQFVNKFD